MFNFRGSMSSLQSGNSGFSVLSGKSQGSSCPSRWLTPSPLIYPLQLDSLGQVDETSIFETSSCLLTTNTFDPSNSLFKSSESQNSITPSSSEFSVKQITTISPDVNNAWPRIFLFITTMQCLMHHHLVFRLVEFYHYF